jgi:hypothetical protein
MSEDTEERYARYYAFGDNPVKLTFIDDVAVKGEVIDHEHKTFKIDNTVVPRIMFSLEVAEIDEKEYRNLCLAKGVKPI